MGVRVTAPDGREWEVSRSLRWPRWRGKSGALDWLDVPFVDVGVDHGIVFGILAAIFIAIALAVVIVVLLPAVLLVVEGAFVLIASLFFRRGWIVKARCTRPPVVREWRVRGPFRSRAAVREVADELRRGVRAEPEHAEVV